MSGTCKSETCHANNGGECMNVVHCDNFAHKPEPNESPSSPRTSGSLPASQADSAFRGDRFSTRPHSLPADWNHNPCGACTLCEIMEQDRDIALLAAEAAIYL